MAAVENKATARRFIEELFNQGNLEIADELLSPNYIDHDPAMLEDVRGPEGMKQYAAMYRSAFPDIHIVIEDQVAEGDKVVTRWIGTGTHQGDLMGIAPTGNRVTVTGIAIDRFSGGKIEETWENYDALGMLQQIGAIPSA